MARASREEREQVGKREQESEAVHGEKERAGKAPVVTMGETGKKRRSEGKETTGRRWCGGKVRDAG